ncbi:MAG: hypothetical protein DMF80_11255 [Acidobacteria bacterium]|nr:MAG: hypothetical protein DMF80_11255 [Acidobacteriota bacterium]PYQ21694.1 MAG: hypothetical protein DMF81_14665 [Acidobacteriota bacterium]
METTAVRLWKRLSREERLAAATVFFREPPEELFGSALVVIVKARHLRPQVARTMAPDEQARALAGVLDPGEALAASLLVALHLGDRRPMLATFLNAAGIPHEDGLLKDESPAVPLGEDAARTGVKALQAAYPGEQVQTYLNTLWLQDPERWAVLERAGEWTA